LTLAVQSNSQKDLTVALTSTFIRSDNNITKENEYNFQIDWRISNRLSLSSISSYSGEIDNSQYLKRKTIDDKKEYLVGKLDRQTFYTTLRAEFFITPELSLQYYGSPYVSTGEYQDYRKVTDSKSKDLSERYDFLTRNGDLLVDDESNVYHDFNDYDFDFTFQEFRSNFVARWEYKTGSTIYFVWTNNRYQYVDVQSPSLSEAFKDIGKIKSENAFMIKLSYWFSL
jgi:hypothetical protein